MRAEMTGVKETVTVREAAVRGMMSQMTMLVLLAHQGKGNMIAAIQGKKIV